MFRPLLLLCAALLLAGPASAQGWTRGHGEADMAGFVDVVTPSADNFAARISVVPNLGEFAPGVGPVVSPEGIAYLATREGMLIAARESGVIWRRPLFGSAPVLAAPLIGSDGGIYVAGSLESGPPPANDTRVARSWIFKFAPDGTITWGRPMPTLAVNSGQVLALNAIGTGQDEIILAAVRHWANTQFQTWLVGFTRDGAVVFRRRTAGNAGEPLTSSGFCFPIQVNCWYGLDPTVASPFPPARRLHPNVHPNVPSVAVAANGVIVVTDGFRGMWGFRFDRRRGLRPVFVKRDGRNMTASAMVPPSLQSVYAVNGPRIAFSGPGPSRADVVLPSGKFQIEGTPSRTGDGRIVTVNRVGGMTITGPGPAVRAEAGAETIAGASISRTHIFVPTVNELVTFDLAGQPVSRFPWNNGGEWPVAIGRNGVIYAQAGGTLFIFRSRGSGVKGQ